MCRLSYSGIKPSIFYWRVKQRPHKTSKNAQNRLSTSIECIQTNRLVIEFARCSQVIASMLLIMSNGKHTARRMLNGVKLQPATYCITVHFLLEISIQSNFIVFSRFQWGICLECNCAGLLCL